MVLWYSLAAVNTDMNECESLHLRYQAKPDTYHNNIIFEWKGPVVL